jgi:hypothetical protein
MQNLLSWAQSIELVPISGPEKNKQDGFLDKDKMMDNVQKHNIWSIFILSLSLLILYSLLWNFMSYFIYAVFSSLQSVFVAPLSPTLY